MPKIIFGLEIDLLTLRVTSNVQDNRRNGLFSQNLTKKKYYVLRITYYVPSFISRKSYFPSLDLEIDLLTLKMILNHQNSTISSLCNQNDTKKRSTSHEKEILHFFLFFFLKKNVSHILTLELTLRP